MYKIINMVSMLSTWITLKGPFSDNMATIELHPGPPVNHTATGSLIGSFWDSAKLIIGETEFI